MHTFTSISTDDLQAALLRNVNLQDIESSVLSKTRLPSSEKTSSSPLFLLRQLSPDLAELAEQSIMGSYPQNIQPGKPGKMFCAPFSPRAVNIFKYMNPLIEKYKPSVIAVDASFAEVGGALHYACSLYHGMGLKASVFLVNETYIQEEMIFQPGDFLPELTVFCLQNKIPILPLGEPQKPIPSENQRIYNQLLQNTYNNFTAKLTKTTDVADMEPLAQGLMQQLFNSNIHTALEREDTAARSCYIAARAYDLSRYLAAIKYKNHSALILYKMDRSLDFPHLIKTFSGKPSSVSEIYIPLEPQHNGSYKMHAAPHEEESNYNPPPTKLSEKLKKSARRFLVTRMNEPLSLDEIDRISSAVSAALRQHPLIERPPGVRATLAAREIAQGYGLIRNGVTRQTLALAAGIAFQHRTGVRQGENTTIEEIFKGTFSRHIYKIPLHPTEEEISKKQRRPLTEEEAAQALKGLSDAAFRGLGPDEALPLDDPSFAEDAMQHPLVQQALKDAMEKGLLNNARKDYQDIINELEDRNYLEMLDSSHATLSKDGQDTIKKSLDEALAKGELSPEKLAEALNNAMSLPSPPGINGDKVHLTPQAETELLAEMMDFQHEGKSSSSPLEDLYVHYALNEKKGIKVSSDKVDYEKLKIMLHQLKKKGLINISGEKKRFTLSHLSLEKLLEGLVRRKESQVLERRAFHREHETDKTEVRRYQRGDSFSVLSTRHTLRRIIRKGKTLEEINYTDLRSFEKKPSNQLDIAVCVDVSASMKEGGKLRYAKMAVAELSKAAIEKHDRVGIIAFSNLGEVVVPVTDKITPLLEATMSLRADQFTNMGNGLSCARKMLLKDQKSNPKYIILITDGQPNAALSEDCSGQTYHSRVASFSRETTMETKKTMGTSHALAEAVKTSRNHIKISVVFISPDKNVHDDSEKTAREIARIGYGRFHKVKAVERLPMEALATVT